MGAFDQTKENIKSQLEQFFSDPKEQTKFSDLLSAYMSGKTNVISLNLDEIEPALANDIVENASKGALEGIELFIEESIRMQNTVIPFGNGYIQILSNKISFTPLHTIGSEHIGKIIRVHGLVNRTSIIHPMYKEAVFKCSECGEDSAPIPQDNPLMLTKPYGKCRINGCTNPIWEPIPELSVMVDSQEFMLQESYEDISSNRVPRAIQCITFKQLLLNYVNCGDDIEMLCVVKAMTALKKSTKSKFNITYLEVLQITKRRKDPAFIEFTPEEVEEIRALAKDPQIYRKMIDTLAPSLYGHDDEKEAVLLAIFGSPEDVREDMTIRGNIHILMVGDPACISGDSRVVKYNGILPQISTIGKHHLEEINIPLRSAVGSNKEGMGKQFHRYENQPVMEVITESGKRLVGSYNQCLLTKDGWKRLDELSVETKIRVLCNIPCNIYSSPISTDLGALLGYKLADGWSNKYKVGFIVNDEEQDLIPEIQNHLFNEFGKVARIDNRMTTPFGQPRKNIHIPVPISYLEINGKNIAEKFSDPFEYLFMSANDVVSCALSWFFEGDGHIIYGGRGKNGIFLKQGSDKDIQIFRNTQLLLLRFGIYSIVDEDSDGTKWLKIRRSNSIRRFVNHIGFRSQKKIKKMDSLVSILPIRNVYDKRWEKIKSLKPFGMTTVYDIYEQNHHQFVANGIIVHNTAKSQLLRAAVELSPRGMYAMGRGTTAAGLTAALHKTENTDEWEISAGVLVLADEGIAAIDEIDKMRDEDRVNIHEAMEQQTVSIDKAGVHAQLKARTALIAAANPMMGRYDQNKSVFENLPKFPPSLFSRFDLIFRVLDIPNEDYDTRVVTHIIENSSGKSPIDRKLLRKYIAFSKKIKPILASDAADALKEYFLSVRKTYTSDQKTFPFSYRQFEAMKRLTLARARSLLKEKADKSDVEVVKRLFDIFLRDVGGDVTAIETGKDANQRTIMGVVEMIKSALAEHPMTKSDLRSRINVDERAFENAFNKMLSIGTILMNEEQGFGTEEIYKLRLKP